MGNWRNRPPRRPYNHHRNHNHHSELPSEIMEDNVPPWEKKFCYVVGSVPWQKVVNTKYITSCYSNVVNWDDSAVEETFQNAKRRFWAEMNGLDCDTSPPNPDIYIDEIDWDPKVDLDLMKELDRDFFAPADEEGEVNNKLLRKYKRFRSSACGSHTNPFGDVRPWDCSGSNNATRVSKDVDNGQSTPEVKASPADEIVRNDEWGRESNFSKNLGNGQSTWEVKASPANEIENKLECTNNNTTRVDVVLESKENGWSEWKDRVDRVSENMVKDESAWEVKATPANEIVGNDIWGRDHRIKLNDRDRDDDDDGNVSDENPWERSNREVVGPRKDSGWGSSCDKDWGWNREEWNVDNSLGQRSSQHYNNNNYNYNYNNNRGWRDYGGGSRRAGRQFGRCNNRNEGFGFRRSNGHREAWNGNNNSSNNYNYNNNSSGYDRNEFGYRNPRSFRGDENRTSDCWATRANNKRRVSFE